MRRQADRSRQGTPSATPCAGSPPRREGRTSARRASIQGTPSAIATGTPCVSRARRPPSPPARRQAAPCTPTGRQIAAGHAVPPSVTLCADSSPRREGRTARHNADRPRHVRRQADRSRQGTPSRRPSRPAPVHRHTVKVEHRHAVRQSRARRPPSPPARRQAARRPQSPPARRQADRSQQGTPSRRLPRPAPIHHHAVKVERHAAMPTGRAMCAAMPTGRAMCADRPTDRGRARRPAVRHALRRFITTP